MKKCSFCAEEIQDEAIKCKHCGEFINKSKPTSESVATTATSQDYSNSVVTADVKYCSFCGSIMKNADLFCGACGKNADFKSTSTTVDNEQEDSNKFRNVKEAIAYNAGQKKLKAVSVLSYAWSALFFVIVCYQLSLGNYSLALWNLVVVAVYVAIGIGVQKRKYMAYDWGMWSNIINTLLGGYYLFWTDAYYEIPLIIIQIFIIILLAKNAELFSADKKVRESVAGEKQKTKVIHIVILLALGALAVGGVIWILSK